MWSRDSYRSLRINDCSLNSAIACLPCRNLPMDVFSRSRILILSVYAYNSPAWVERSGIRSFRAGPYLAKKSIYVCNVKSSVIYNFFGRAIAQAVRRWLPIAEARVRSRVSSSGICGGQSTSVSPANLHSTNCSTITLTYHLGLVQQARSGRSTRDLVPPD
jgi:hypothetical protein